MAAFRMAQKKTADVSGVNVPSKAFGEKIHHERIISRRLPGGAQNPLCRREPPRLVILDVSTPEEYGRFCIPGGVNVPGGDFILWADELKQKRDDDGGGQLRRADTQHVGTAALRRLGLTNVRALKNGTMGWVLAAWNLETKPARSAPAPVREPSTERRRWRQNRRGRKNRVDLRATARGRAGEQ